VARNGDQVSFGARGELFSRSLEYQRNFLARIKTDGTGRARISDTPITANFGASPGGDWVPAVRQPAGI
jgi:hypothetical protein